MLQQSNIVLNYQNDINGQLLEKRGNLHSHYKMVASKSKMLFDKTQRDQ